MTTSLYDLTIPVFLKALGNMRAFLEKGRAHSVEQGIDPDSLLQLRLIGDMHPLAAQIQRCSDSAKGCAVRLGGLENVSFPDDETTFEGKWFTVRAARNEPRPIQEALPIWVGGSGEKRTLRIAARFADGWNVPFVSPEAFAAKRDVLHQHCADVGRDPAEVSCAVNLGLAWTEDSLRQQFGNIADRVRPGVLGGSVEQLVDRIGEYVDAGADQVNLALRAPFDIDALEQFSASMQLT